jgi:hypothetical protein
MKWIDIEYEAVRYVEKNILSAITIEYTVTCGAYTGWLKLSPHFHDELKQHLQNYINNQPIIDV